jgi:hypothetical protein
MHLRRRIELRDEEGTTLVELLVGMGMGMVVLAGLAMVMIVTLHGNARVDARVEATDNARVVMTRMIEELHSACVSPKSAPVKEGSTRNTLIFTHGPYGSTTTGVPAAGPTETRTEITYSVPLERLSQKDGSLKPITLLSNVSPISAAEPVFSYWKYNNGSLARLPLTALGTEANEAILVKIAFQARPKSEPVSDAGAATKIRNSATLRLTPPEYNATTVLPCE